MTILDPILLWLLCGWSPLHFFERWSEQREILDKAEEKFVAELEVFKMLRRIRDSFEITKGLIDKRTRKMLNFNKHRILQIEDEDQSTSEDNVSGESDHEYDDTPHQDLTFNQKMQLSIIRGIKLNEDNMKSLKDIIKDKSKAEEWKII